VTSAVTEPSQPDAPTLVTIGTAAEITGVATKTIRYYADLGLLPPTGRSKGGYRLFSVADLWRLELVRTLRDLDFGLDEIGRLLRGQVPTEVAVALQRHAVGLRRRQLARTEVVLARAESELDDLEDAEAAEVLRGLTATFEEEAEERRRFVVQAAATLAERRIGEAAASVEAAEAAESPALVAARAEVAPVWEAMAERGVDPEHFSAELTALRERAEALAARGARPDGDAAREVCEAWLALLLGEDPTDEEVDVVAAHAPAWLAPDDASAAVAAALGQAAALSDGERLILDALEIGLAERARRG